MVNTGPLDSSKNEEEHRIDVDADYWNSSVKSFKRSKIINWVMITIVLVSAVEHLTTPVLPLFTQRLVAYNVELQKKAKLEDRDVVSKLQRELSEKNIALTLVNKKLAELQPTGDLWKHKWMLREAEAQYAFCKILEDFDVEMEGKYKISDNYLYSEADSHGVRYRFHDNPNSIQREAITLFNKEYPSSKPTNPQAPGPLDPL